MMKKLALLLLFLFGLSALFLPACSVDKDDDKNRDATADDDDDDDSAPSFRIDAVNPSKGPVEGGTQVTIVGSGFVAGAKVSFGGKEGIGTAVATEKKLTTTTPTADKEGGVTVRVTLPDGKAAELPNGFTYGEGDEPDPNKPPITIGFCILQHPPETSTDRGTATEEIYGRVFAEGSTPGEGKGAGIKGQVGYGPLGTNPTTQADKWSFVDATYNTDADGLSEGDKSNDEYKAQLTVNEAGSYSYIYRFSGDGGKSWTLCDLDGSENGFQAEQMGKLTVKGDKPEGTVDWCVLQFPEETSAPQKALTDLIYGRVFKEGVTEPQGRGANIVGQIGVGPIFAPLP